MEEMCPTCLLTAPAAQLLARLGRQLQETRGVDGSWEATTCPECERITAITDPQGWTFGDTGCSLESEEQEATAISRALARLQNG